MFFQIVSQGFAYGLVYGSAYFVVTQLGFSLTFKLRLSYFYGDNGDQTFTEVFTRNFHFRFFQSLAFFGVFLQYAGQCRTESGFVCTAFNGVDVVDIRVKVFAESGVIHNGAFDRNALFLGVQIDDIVNKRCVGRVQEAYEFFHSFF